MITIKNLKLKGSTIFEVDESETIPMVVEHKKCVLIMKDNGDKHKMFRYTCAVTDEKGNILTEHQCSDKTAFDEIKVHSLFWDKIEAMDYCSKKIMERKEYLLHNIKKFVEELELIEKNRELYTC